MPARPVLRALLGAACFVLCAPACAQARLALFRHYAAQPNALARRTFLIAQLPQLPPPEQSFARQLLAATDNELGLYDRALRDFPFDQREPMRALVPPPNTLPTVRLYDDHRFVDTDRRADAIPAAPAIAAAARGHRLVMINEAHHDAHTRELVLQLLPLLRAEGFDHFAAEALIEGNKTLRQRGYPTADSGTEYLDEPLYGEIIRTAIRLGYTLVPYDPTTDTPDRDAAQAANLYERVFAHNPKARLFVLAGYAHIDKAKGQLGDVTPMAMRLAEFSGIQPLSIDQTTFRAIGITPPENVYDWMVASYHPRQPVVLHTLGDDKLWSGDPARYDISVILPPPLGKPRPDWLALDGLRQRYRIDTHLCMGTVPCVVEAHYASETDTATPADRYTFLTTTASSVLYLFPGSYRLRAWGVDGHTLGERVITVK